VDNNLQTPWLVRLYDEFGRHTLAMRGERTLFDATGTRTTSKIDEVGDAWFRLEDWHEYHLTCSLDLPETPGADIGFEVRTDQGIARVSFPVSQIAASAWHDLVGRYDGHTLTLFCDGRLQASKPHKGALAKNSEPLLIGAETDRGKVVRHFRGELEEAALRSRALSDAEISTLSRKP